MWGASIHLRILEINKFYRLSGGAEKCFVDTIDLLREKGHEVSIFSMKTLSGISTPFEKYFIDEWKSDSIGFVGRAGLFLKALHNFQAEENISRLIEDCRPQIAHIHNFTTQLTPSILKPLKKAGIPIVHTLHDYSLACYNSGFYDENLNRVCEMCRGKRFYNILKNRCVHSSWSVSFLGMLSQYLWSMGDMTGFIDHYIAPGRFMKEKMAEHGFPADKISVVNNCVTADDSPGEPLGGYVLFLGAFIPKKGAQDLISAYRRIKPSADLVLAGSGPYEGCLREMAVENEGNGRIIFPGFLDQATLRKYVRESLFVVVPSLWYENYPYSILQSLASGKAVIGARSGGIPEIVEQGYNGLIYDPGNVDQLAHCMEKLLSDPAETAKMGANSLKKAKNQYNSEKYYRELIGILEMVN